MNRMLIVEDDRAMSIALRASFAREGFECVMAADGREGLRQAMERTLDVVLLDVMLPRMNGRDVCQRLREACLDVPILMITALGHELDVVAALRMGADDYIIKPFGFNELLARVQAVMRRRMPVAPRARSLCFADVVIDVEKREVHRDGRLLELSPRDFDILCYFVQHRGRLVTRGDLVALFDCDERSVTSRLLDTYVWRLRQSIESDPGRPSILVTVRGRGYLFETSVETSER
jgi:two-component system response regulator VicR